jgi:hypothetical protein
MGEQLNEKVSVVFVYNAADGSIMPRKLQWRNREYILTKLGYHHAVRQGRTLMHIFHVTDDTTAFRLRLDTETLHWILEEVYDTVANQ